MYKVSKKYNEIIYSGDAKHRLKLLFNGVEYETSNIKTESVKIKSNILSSGDERFSLDNFVSKEVELIMHDINLEDIQAPVSISIGTLVDNDYEYVPIGIFNISETPTTDKNKVTIKLRDNSVKFDVPYDGSELIKTNDGSATMKQILNDICGKCEVELGTLSFTNEDTEVSVYDNTINARVYVMYIAEKAGCIATIDRFGKLVLINVNNKLLPDEYTELEYIESTGTQYIDSGVNADNKLSIELKMSINENVNNSGMGAIYNGTSGYIRHHSIFMNSGSNQNRYYYANSNKTIQATRDNEIHDYNLDIYNKKISIDEQEISITYNDFDTTLNYWLFARNSNQDNLKQFTSVKLYSAKFYYEEYLVRDFIPCLRKSDNKTGLYDLANNIFYENNGIGEFEYKELEGLPNQSEIIELDPYLFESYTVGDKVRISRVVYEDAIRKFEYGDESESTLYINSSNPFIIDGIEIQNIYDMINNFDINSLKISKMIGNPAIDPYDIIKFSYNDETYRSLAQNELTYNGVFIQKFDTQIGTKKKAEENVTLNTEESKFRRVFTRIDQAEGNIELNTSQITNISTDLKDNYYTLEQTNQLIQNAETGVTNTFSEAGGNNIFRNTGLWFENTDYNVDNSYISNTSGDLICNIAGREFIKTHNGLAFVSYYYDGRFTGPIIVGYTPESVAYSAFGAYFPYMKTIVKDNITYYIGNSGYFMEGNYTSTDGRTVKLSEEALTHDQAAELLIEKIGNYSPYEFWNGSAIKNENDKSSNMTSILLQNGIFYQEQNVSNGNYTISFKYKKLIELANITVKINDKEYTLLEMTDTEFEENIVVNSQHINLQFITDVNNSCEIYDIMVNAGTVKLAYSQNQNETTTDTVNISKGITITSTNTNTTFKANARGIKTLDKNNNTLTEFTDTGMTTKKQIVEETATICNVLIQKVGNQTWFTKL